MSLDSDRLRLFYSAQDVDDDRRQASQQRALHQARCRCCGRFAKPGAFRYGEICSRCVQDDKRLAIKRKVEQARRWWKLTRPGARSPFV